MFMKYFFIVALFELFLLVTWAKEFTSYWNVPTFACNQRFNLNLLNVTERYGIVQNSDDNFRGDKISILYDPGLFPAIYENGSYRNGGVPQSGDIKAHLENFEHDVDKYIPDRENSGLVIIDFEVWRPVYRQNFGKFLSYKHASVELVQRQNPTFTMEEIHKEASRRFTESAKVFMLETIQLGKKLRPYAKWGYYGFPHCFNGRGNVTEDCEQQICDENNATQWLYDNSDVIFPSIYMSERIPLCNRPLMVKGRIREAARLSSNVDGDIKPLVIAYHRYKYPDSLQYLTESDNINSVEAAKETGADGIVVWGAWNDVNTIEKCIEFYNYLEENLGPSFQISVTEPPMMNTTTESSAEITEVPTLSSATSLLAGGVHFVKVVLFLFLTVVVRNR